MNYLNLNEDKTSNVVIELNQLLADYHMYYQNLRNFHWNITGKNFFDLHNKFEELYTDARTKIDEIAERILTLRFHPMSNYSDYLKQSTVQEYGSDLTDVEMVSNLLKNHQILIQQLRKVVETADTAGDEGSLDMAGAYIRELEKSSWMLDAWTKDKVGRFKEVVSS